MTQNDSQIMDLDFLRSTTGGDVQFEKELFALFIESGQSNVNKMEKSLVDSDENAWYMASHAFKGAAASIGAFPLSKALEYAQNHPKENFKDKTNVLNNIKIEFKKVIDFLTKEFLSK